MHHYTANVVDGRHWDGDWNDDWRSRACDISDIMTAKSFSVTWKLFIIKYRINLTVLQLW